MLLPRRLWISLVAVVASVSAASPWANPPDPSVFKNLGVVRTVDVGGATTFTTTAYQITARKDGASTYFVSLSEEEAMRTSWYEAKVKGTNIQLEVKPWGPGDHTWLFIITLSKPLIAEETLTINFNTLQSHASVPVPATVKQTEPQLLQYSSGIYVLSIYPTERMRVKFKVPKGFVSHTGGDELKQFADPEAPNVLTKESKVVTYGPFVDLPPTAEVRFITEDQRPVNIHYEYDAPVLTVKSLKRAVELSHWGSNINIEEKVHLLNDGARMKGFFSRIEHIKQTVQPQTAQPHVLKTIPLHLPGGVRDPYFYDIIGNVSTSNFRPAPPVKKGAKRSAPLDRNSFLQLKPRYPLLGGWNYTFTLGYDMPLEDWVSYNSKTGEYVVGVPFLTAISGATYDDVEFKMILPEGAEIVNVQAPLMGMAPYTVETHVTYLDSIGRPAIILKRRNATDRHTGIVYVTYKVSTFAHLRKPFVVAAAFFGIFVVSMALRRVDFTIHSRQDKRKKVL